MILLIYICLVANSLVSVYTYYRFFKKRVLFDNRYSMTITMSSSMIISVILALQLSFITSFQFEWLAGAMMVMGLGIGATFGALARVHSVLTGISAGMMGGLMGAMTGSVIRNPALCGLPMDNNSTLLFNMAAFTVFGTFVLFLTLGLILYSLKV